MMSYKEIYETHQKKYNELLEDYQKFIDTDEYKDAFYNTSFDFLRVLYLAKRIEIFTNADKGCKPSFNFSSLQEAMSTYRDIVRFDGNIENLLNKATIITQASSYITKINKFVKESDYLDDNYLINDNKLIVDTARECLRTLPNTKLQITEELKTSVLKDILTTFNEQQIKALAEKKMFKPVDVNNLAAIITDKDTMNKLNVVCNVLDIGLVLVKSEVLRLKGTTFNNEDGTSRQDNIKTLGEYLEKGGDTPLLDYVPYIYKPEIGAEEPAVKILWNDKELGCLPREVAIQLHNEYTDNIINTKANKVIGGGSVNYGVEVTLDVYDKVKEKEEEKEM